MSENARMTELVDILTKAARAYEQDAAPIMSDFEYDKMYDELLGLEARTGVVLDGSPTHAVGHEVVSQLNKVRHEHPLLSLDKTKEVSKLESFLGAHRGILSWKLDGLTIVLKYSQGGLVQAVTRGNGEIGEDVTHNGKFFRNIPKKIDFMGDLSIRGEAVISFAEFERINGEADEKYKNPRNLCAGTIRQLNSRVAASRNVDFYAFAVLNDIDFNEKSQTLKFLQDMGFDTPCYDEVDADGVTAAVESFKNAVEDLDYATDGLVLTYDNIEYSESLGATSKFPRDSIAFKWADELVRTRLLDIEWNTSRTGLINPIAIFEAVDIEGSNVERASLHNLSIVESLELGKNDEISVYKANMIIPQIAENFTRSGGMLPPNNCPVCEAPTHIKDEKGVKTLHCTNPNCKARVVRTIVHYASRDAANIDGLSIQTIEKFIELGFLSNFSDIYKLGAHEAQIVALHGFGEKSFAKLMASVEKSKDMSMANFIYGLGIDDVGLAGAKDLCRHFNYDFEAVRRAEPLELAKIEGFGGGTVAALYEYFKNFEQDEDISKEELASFISKICKENNIKNMGPLRVEDMCRHFDYDIKNIIGATFQDFATIKTYVRKDGKLVEGGNFGGVIAANIYEYFQNESNNRIVDAAGSHVRFAAETAPVAAEDSPIFGKTFVITGDLTHFKNRKELVDKIEVAGGKVAGSVSKKTDYLINNDTQSASSKNKKAQELGVSIISEQDFLDLC